MTTSTTTSRKTNTINSSPFTTTATKPALCPVPRPPWPNTKRPRRSTRRRSPLSKRISSSCSLPAGMLKSDGKRKPKRLSAIRNPIAHHPLKLSPLRKQDDHRLVAREDGSLFVEKLVSDKATFLLDFSTDTRGEPLTGFRVEALADPKLPSKGPGLTSHGNFVLSEFRAYAWIQKSQTRKFLFRFPSPGGFFSKQMERSSRHRRERRNGLGNQSANGKKSSGDLSLEKSASCRGSSHCALKWLSYTAPDTLSADSESWG